MMGTDAIFESLPLCRFHLVFRSYHLEHHLHLERRNQYGGGELQYKRRRWFGSGTSVGELIGFG